MTSERRTPRPSREDIALRARALIEQEDPRPARVEQHLAPYLPKGSSPDQAHWAAAVAVAALDAHPELNRRRPQRVSRRTGRPIGRTEWAIAIGVLLMMTLVLLGVAGAALVWLWTLVL
ncbi:hypothetical protein [Streptomyces alkaliphilus]|uniref:Uncharacterized protein n=1 Tax=Streptomyces alkaliphilus TaxID=1472722 RepID=A0A7W3Y1U3_9ACTN|nr:hypothetical protein [Streptomyces alkaliphilus]MBB0244721.1 hypothetical protein [Streptomyces alkaliphilus]MQS06973.1 hypothetical protein [Streptomyces alkaliphilus]